MPKPHNLATWHSILSILQKYLKDALNLPKAIEQSLVTGRYIDIRKLY